MKTNYTVIVAIIILVAAGLAVYFVGIPQSVRNAVPGGEPVACTMEALVCPDGSAVGRSGPKCEFAACPNQEYFLGKMTAQGGDYFLITAAPAGTTEEVTYSLPLKFSRMSNVLGTLVGTEVRVKGKFTSGNNLLVETIESRVEKETSEGVLGVGETKFVNGVRITLNKIVEDSRCPAEVQCIWAGRLVANVTLKSDTDEETVDLPSDAREPKAFDTFLVSLVGIAPASKTSGTPPAAGSYKLTFRVENNQ
jgi:hypothetical protein